MAPNIYYMGAASVVRLGPVRIAGMSGIWKGYNYNKPHHERLPYGEDDIKSIYHIRELDVRKLLQLRKQVDICISHDWPRAIERHGNERALFNMKSHFEQESKDGTLGNQAASYVMDRLRPPYWFAAHMHCKFSATKVYAEDKAIEPEEPLTNGTSKNHHMEVTTEHVQPDRNEDEIDLDLDDDEDLDEKQVDSQPTMPDKESKPSESVISEDVRALLPASFSRPAQLKRTIPGQPVPPSITNKAVRFLALDKCLPGRKFLQLLDIIPASTPSLTPILPRAISEPRYHLTYDPEWLAITRVFASRHPLALGDRTAKLDADLGEEVYLQLIEAEEKWVEENVVKPGKLNVPLNFELTAPVHMPGSPEIVTEGPEEYNNPQMAAFCELLGIENRFFASSEEREARMSRGPPKSERRFDDDGRRGRGGRGSGRGGGRQFGGHRGQGGGGGRGRGRGRGW